MILARILSNIYKENGIILIDSEGQKYICGNPKKENPITVKLLRDNLNELNCGRCRTTGSWAGPSRR